MTRDEGAAWLAAESRVRRDRARSQCECVGQCSEKVCAGGRCTEVHQCRSSTSGRKGKPAYLTVISLDGDRRNLSDQNLLAVCQWCRP